MTRYAAAALEEIEVSNDGRAPLRPVELDGESVDAHLGWEVFAPARRAYDAGDYAEAAEQGRRVLEEHQQYPVVLYNVACCEALAGQRTEALEHLRRAIELSDSFREAAGEDPDLESLRQEREFQELIGG